MKVNEPNTLGPKLFVIPGDPTPLARPRFSHRRIYDSQKNIKVAAGLYVQQQQGNDPFLEGPLFLDITFYMKTPDSISAKRRSSLYGKPHVFKADLDNLIKFTSDICSGVVYKDDCIIAAIEAKKVYSDNPRTEFTLKVIDEKS